MATNSIDAVVANMKPPRRFLKTGAATVAARLYSPFFVGGLPGAAVAPSPGVAGEALTSYAGQLPFTNPVSGVTNLSRFSASCNVAGRLILADRLWHNSGLNVTLNTAQTVNSVAWPARDVNGSTNGEDVMIGLEGSTVMGAGTPSLTMSYTNSAGASGKTSVAVAAPATMAVGSFLELPLAAGDTGVRSIQSFTQSATMTSGVHRLVAYRILAEMDIIVANVGVVMDIFQLGKPPMYDNTVPFLLWLPTTTTAPTLMGSFGVVQG